MRSTSHADAFASRAQHASFEFPSTARDAHQAARIWFQFETNLTAVQFRDKKFREHCNGRTDSSLERRIRRDTFHQAFAEAVGHIVVEEGRLRATPA